MAQQHYSRKEDIIILTAFENRILTLNRSRTFYIEEIENDSGTYYNVLFKTLNNQDEAILGSYLKKERAAIALKRLFKAISRGKRFHRMYRRFL